MKNKLINLSKELRDLKAYDESRKVYKLIRVATEDQVQKKYYEPLNIRVERISPRDEVSSISRDAASLISDKLGVIGLSLESILAEFDENVLHPKSKIDKFDKRLVTMVEELSEAYEKVLSATMLSDHLRDGTGD